MLKENCFFVFSFRPGSWDLGLGLDKKSVRELEREHMRASEHEESEPSPEEACFFT